MLRRDAPWATSEVICISRFPPLCCESELQWDLSFHLLIRNVISWYAEQQTAEDMSAENIANLVEVNIRYVSCLVLIAWKG